MNKNLCIVVLFCFIAQVMLFSCKKNSGKDNNTNNNNNNNDTATVAKKTSYDSALLDTRDIYLWYNQIPSTYDPNKFSDLGALMKDIRQYSKETGFSNPVDRFSFAVKKSEWDNASSGIVNLSSSSDDAKDLGFSIFFLPYTNKLYVKYVESASPAGLAGIKRGWQVKSINGDTNIDTTSASVSMIVDAVFYATAPTSFTFIRPDGSPIDIILKPVSYQQHPVMADTVLTLSASSKVGYMVFNSFLGDSLDIDNNFKRVFAKFDQSNVNDVVIDLRYNGGGYVYIAEKLLNYLAPQSAQGQIMFTEQFNNKYSKYNSTYRFSRTSNLNLNRIFFIVSDNTASASELVINSLKPYMTVKLVGPSRNTYGKPVGFFPIPVSDWYIFPVSFKSVNKDGEGNYYNGFTVDWPINDGVNKNWGDVNEWCLGAALKYIQTGSFRLGDDRDRFIFTNSNYGLHKKQEFKVSVENRIRF